MEKVKDFNKYLELLDSLELFNGISSDSILGMLNCFNSDIKKYKSEEIIIETGDEIKKIGIILKGQIYISKEDYFGNRNIITELGQGEIFGEVFLSAGIKYSPVTVTSELTSEILFIEYKKIIGNCGAICDFHTKIIQNMLKLLSRRNILLNEKIEILGKRSIREKINFYLLKKLEKLPKNKSEVIIDFSRQELADFLCIDRSAMTRELSKMQKSGLIDIDKRKIIVLKKIIE